MRALMSSLKGIFAVAASIVFLAIGSQAFACSGGNQCPVYNQGTGTTITGQIWGSGGFVGQATGQNHTLGPVTDKITISETGGFTNLFGETVTNTCESGTCPSYSKMAGEGAASGHQYEFVSGTGSGSSSSVQGGSALEIKVQSSIFKMPVTSN